MESVPDPEPDAGGPGGEPNPYLPDARAEPVRRRVSRGGGRSYWALVVAAAAGLAVGAASGYAAAPERTAPSASISAASTVPSRGRYAAPLGSGGSLSGQASVPDSYSPLFTRQSNGVTIRAFLDGGSEDVSGATQGCPNGPPLVAEVSTSKMVGVSVDWGSPDSSLYPANSSVRTDVLGSSEGDPIAVIVVETGPEVADIRATFSTSGMRSDSMSPSYGWAVLAAPIPSIPSPQDAPIGRVESIGKDHQVLATSTLRANAPVVAWFGYAPSCVLP